MKEGLLGRETGPFMASGCLAPPAPFTLAPLRPWEGWRGGQAIEGAGRRRQKAYPRGRRVAACANRVTAPRGMFFVGRGRFLLHRYQFYVVKPQLPMLAQLSKRLSPLLAAPIALLLSQGQAKAMLNVNIFDEGSNLKVTVTGSISAGNAGTIAAAPDQCYSNGAPTGQFFNTTFAQAYVCTGYDQASLFYALTGPPGLGGIGSVAANSAEGLSFQLHGLA